MTNQLASWIERQRHGGIWWLASEAGDQPSNYKL
jgi:hypothetical protein